MASAERESITRVWGRCPQRGSLAELLMRGSVEADSILSFRNANETQICPFCCSVNCLNILFEGITVAFLLGVIFLVVKLKL